MHTETETAPGGGDKRVPQRGETTEGDSCPQRPGPHRVPRAAPSSVGRLPKYNANNSGHEPGHPIREPPGPRSPGPRQLSSLGHGGDRGCGEAAVAPGCLPQIPRCKSSSHVPTSERGFFLQSAQFLALGDPETQHDWGERLGLGIVWPDAARAYGQMVSVRSSQALRCVN